VADVTDDANHNSKPLSSTQIVGCAAADRRETLAWWPVSAGGRRHRAMAR
jgi:hypothetical protein